MVDKCSNSYVGGSIAGNAALASVTGSAVGDVTAPRGMGAVTSSVIGGTGGGDANALSSWGNTGSTSARSWVVDVGAEGAVGFGAAGWTGAFPNVGEAANLGRYGAVGTGPTLAGCKGGPSGAGGGAGGGGGGGC